MSYLSDVNILAHQCFPEFCYIFKLQGVRSGDRELQCAVGGLRICCGQVTAREHYGSAFGDGQCIVAELELDEVLQGLETLC